MTFELEPPPVGVGLTGGASARLLVGDAFL